MKHVLAVSATSTLIHLMDHNRSVFMLCREVDYCLWRWTLPLSRASIWYLQLRIVWRHPWIIISAQHTSGRHHRTSHHKSHSLVKSRGTFCSRLHTNFQIPNSEPIYQNICVPLGREKQKPHAGKPAKYIINRLLLSFHPFWIVLSILTALFTLSCISPSYAAVIENKTIPYYLPFQ